MLDLELELKLAGISSNHAMHTYLVAQQHQVITS